MSNNIKTWRTVSHGTVVLRKGQTGHYLVINVGISTGEKPRPYFFSRRISKEEEAIAETQELISLWDHINHPVREEVNMAPAKKPTAVKGLRLFFSEELLNGAAILVATNNILLKDEREHMPMAILFKDLLEAGKIPAGTKYMWLVRPNQDGTWIILKAVELVTPRSIKRMGVQSGQIPAIYCNS
jgi:hypothetical protein